jgi:hypothetical protein
MRSFIALAALLVGTATAQATPLYKCVDAKGVASYQQTPCQNAKQQVAKGYVAPVPVAKNLSWAANSGTDRRLAQQRQALYAAEGNRVVVQSDGPSAAERAQIAKLDQDVAGLGTLNSRGKREMAADLRQQQSQLASGSPVTAAPVRDYPSAPVVSGPRTVSDQYGNQYTQPPGSNFVLDQKTGKTCVKNGNFILECH